jgi:ubiquinol-cytochrome c reductase cytochrome b subunit
MTPPGWGRTQRAMEALDSRTGAASVLRVTLRKVFPDHWSFLLGEVAVFCFVILLATGTFLTFFYVPSTAEVTYDGEYAPLQGQEVSAAFDSVMALSFDVQAGLLMRQVHHWSALLFVAVVVLHLCRIFFTGAFRRPRELNWLVGFTLLVLVLAAGFTGYSLPDDLLSGTGARIAYSAALSIPFVGPWVASLVFGGEFPTEALITRFYVLHIMILPAAIAGLIALHIALLVLQKHTQYRGPKAREDNVVGRRLWPTQAFLSIGLFFLTAAITTFLGGLFQVNPIWSYGPFDAAVVSSPAQPDWYVGWLDGALRIFPPFEPEILGVVIPSAFIPGIVLPGLLFTIVALWPFIEARLTGDHDEHHVLDPIWAQPVRFASGIAILVIFGVLTLAGGNDVLAFYFSTDIQTLTRIFQVMVIVLPIVSWIVAYRLARSLRRRAAADRAANPGATASRPAGRRLRRTAAGGFEEIEP